MLRKIITILISFSLLFEQSGFAQVAGTLVLPSFTGGMTAGDVFRPTHLRSISYDPPGNNFRTLLDQGSAKENDPLKLENHTRQLFNYFLIGLSLPNDSFWVNLRPDSPDNVIDGYLAKTDIGQVMLEADVQLKKDTARYTSPDTSEGREYWDKLYRKAQELFTNEDITIPTLTRPWIVPDEIILRQAENNAYIYKATLKVMLESDYLKNSAEYSFNDPRLKELNDYSSQLIRELILPKLTKDVNISRRYAPLRQVYFSLILAQWFKNKSQVASRKSQEEYGLLFSKIDSRDLNGLASKTSWSKETYFKEYQKSFKNGEYNRQENVQTAYGISLRQYFSGGIKLDEIASSMTIKAHSLVNFFQPSYTIPEIIETVPDHQFEIKEIKAGAFQPRGYLQSEIPAHPYPGAPASDLKDGGKGSEEKRGQLSRAADAIAGMFGRLMKKQNELSVPARKIDPAVDNTFVDYRKFSHVVDMLTSQGFESAGGQGLPTLSEVSVRLGLDKRLDKKQVYKEILASLASGKLSKATIDWMIGDSYDPEAVRLGVLVNDQNSNPQKQGVFEAVSNSLDAMGFKIGQFGKGVKQMIAWLETGDCIEVFSRVQGGQAFKLVLARGADISADKGQPAQKNYYISIRPCTAAEFGAAAETEGVAGLEHGTVVRMLTARQIASSKEEISADRPNTISGIIEGIHDRFPFVPTAVITTQVDDLAPEKVNGYEHKIYIVPAQGPVSLSELRARGSVHIRLTRNSIAIVDDGSGMAGDTVSRMFVTGTKSADPFNAEEAAKNPEAYRKRIEAEARKTTLVYDPTLKDRMFFARGGEVIKIVDIPADKARGAAMKGGLMIDLGLLMEVPDSRDVVYLKPGVKNAPSAFQQAVYYAMSKVADSELSDEQKAAGYRELTDEDKLHCINTLIIGLEGLVQGNDTNKAVVKAIRAEARSILAPVVARLEAQGYVIFPHDRQFEKLAFAADKKVLYLQENLFDWRGAASLKRLGGKEVPGITLGGEKRLPLVVFPFTAASLEPTDGFHSGWERMDNDSRLPSIKTDRFVAIPAQVGGSLLDLATRRLKGADEGIENEFQIEVAGLKVMISDEVDTSYAFGTVSNMQIAEINDIPAGEIDAQAANNFLRMPPVNSGGASPQAARVEARKNNLALRSDGKMIEVGTGKEISIAIPGDIVKGIKEIIPVSNSFFLGKDAEGKTFLLKFDPETGSIGISSRAFPNNSVFPALTVSPDAHYIIIRNRMTGIDQLLNCASGEFSALDITPQNVDYRLAGWNFTQDSKSIYHIRFVNKGDKVARKIKLLDPDTLLSRGEFEIAPLEPAAWDDIRQTDPAELDRLIKAHFSEPGAGKVLKFADNKVYYLIDLAGKAVFHSSAPILTDATGVYSLMLDADGELTLLIHGTGKRWRAKDFNSNGRGSVVETLWQGKEVYYRISFYDGAKTQLRYFNANGPVNAPEKLKPDYVQESGFIMDKTMLHTSILVNKREKEFPLEELLFLSRQDELLIKDADAAEGVEVYKHPYFELFMYEQEGKIEAFDPKSGKVYSLEPGDSIRYFEPQGIGMDVQAADGKAYTVVQSQIGVSRRVPADLIFDDKTPCEYIIKVLDKGYELERIVGRSGIILSPLPDIDREKYDKASFDGKSFVFIDSRTGEARYLDPATIFRGAAAEPGKSQGRLLPPASKEERAARINELDQKLINIGSPARWEENKRNIVKGLAELLLAREFSYDVMRDLAGRLYDEAAGPARSEAARWPGDSFLKSDQEAVLVELSEFLSQQGNKVLENMDVINALRDFFKTYALEQISHERWTLINEKLGQANARAVRTTQLLGDEDRVVAANLAKVLYKHNLPDRMNSDMIVYLQKAYAGEEQDIDFSPSGLQIISELHDRLQGYSLERQRRILGGLRKAQLEVNFEKRRSGDGDNEAFATKRLFADDYIARDNANNHSLGLVEAEAVIALFDVLGEYGFSEEKSSELILQFLKQEKSDEIFARLDSEVYKLRDSQSERALDALEQSLSLYDLDSKSKLKVVQTLTRIQAEYTQRSDLLEELDKVVSELPIQSESARERQNKHARLGELENGAKGTTQLNRVELPVPLKSVREDLIKHVGEMLRERAEVGWDDKTMAVAAEIAAQRLLSLELTYFQMREILRHLYDLEIEKGPLPTWLDDNMAVPLQELRQDLAGGRYSLEQKKSMLDTLTALFLDFEQTQLNNERRRVMKEYLEAAKSGNEPKYSKEERGAVIEIADALFSLHYPDALNFDLAWKLAEKYNDPDKAKKYTPNTRVVLGNISWRINNKEFTKEQKEQILQGLVKGVMAVRSQMLGETDSQRAELSEKKMLLRGYLKDYQLYYDQEGNETPGETVQLLLDVLADDGYDEQEIYHLAVLFKTAYIDKDPVLSAYNVRYRDTFRAMKAVLNLRGSGEPSDLQAIAALERVQKAYYLNNVLGAEAKRQAGQQAPATNEAAVWQSVQARRDAFIAQARAAYAGLLKFIPEERKAAIEWQLKPFLARLYERQEAEIVRIFREKVKDAKVKRIDFEEGSLPFDAFAENMAQVMSVFPGYLKKLQGSEFAQEPNELQERFLVSLFANSLELALNAEGRIIPPLDEELELLGLGWSPRNPEQARVMSKMTGVMRQVREAGSATAGLKVMEDITAFISYFCAREPAKNIDVVLNQLARMNGLNESAKVRLFDEMRQVFEINKLKDMKAAIDNQMTASLAGQGRAFVVFLTNEVEQVPERQAQEFAGKNNPMPAEGVYTSQIMKLQQAFRKTSERTLISMDELISAIADHIAGKRPLPQMNQELEDKILKKVAQREAGASAAETAQNSRDGTRGMKGELVLSSYIQVNPAGKKESVDEAADNGTGALEEVALLIIKSTKVLGQQVDLTGFFGSGKFTLFEGVDRLEIISKNAERAFLFGYRVERDPLGRPTALVLERIQSIDDARLQRGVIIRRIKKLENTVPELDWMLTQRSWKTFAGLMTGDDFKIFIVDHEGVRREMTVEHEVLAEVEFKPAINEKNSHPVLRVISAKDMPLQVVDLAGQRVKEIKGVDDEYLELVPHSLRRHVQDLGIIIQIPLPCIENRTGFEGEAGYLEDIKKYVAAAFYKALVHKTLTQTSPQFVFEGFSHDWESNDSYWDDFTRKEKADPEFYRRIVALAKKIEEDRINEVSADDLRMLMPREGKLDLEKNFVYFMTMLEVPSPAGSLEKTMSMMGRRARVLKEVDARRVEEFVRRQKRMGKTTSAGLDYEKSSNYNARVGQAQGIAEGHKQMENPQDYIVEPRNDAERRLVIFAEEVAGNFGIDRVLLLNDQVRFAGCFGMYKGRKTFFLVGALAKKLDDPRKAGEAANTVIHELAHSLEARMSLDEKEFWDKGHIAHLSNFTHDSIGPFAEAMKYVSAVWLTSVNAKKAADSKDGGYETIDNPVSLKDYVEEVLKAGAKKIKIWFDIDNTVFDHKLKLNDNIFYPTQNFVSQRLKMIRASLSETEYKAREKDILADIIKECVFWEQRWLEAKKLKDVAGIKEFLDYAKANRIEVDLITNRFDDPELRQITVDILKSLGIEQGEDYTNIIFVGSGNGKAEKIKGNIKDEQVFFVDNNRQNVKSIADQLSDLPAVKTFYLDRSRQEGRFDYEELREQADALLAGGLKNSQDRAELELFLGCASLEIAKLDKTKRAEKIAEIRGLMRRAGLDQPGDIDRKYIDQCLEDIEKGHINLETYLGDINQAKERGDIVELDRARDRDLMDPLDFGLAYVNTRLLYPHGREILEKLILNGRSKLNTLVIGPGTGRECWDIYAFGRKNNREIKVNTLGLTAIPANLRLKADFSEIKNSLISFLSRGNPEFLSGLDEYLGSIPGDRRNLGRLVHLKSGAIPLKLALDLQDKDPGAEIFESLEKPYIDKQYLGNLNNSRINDVFDFIYDNRGGFFYSTRHDGLEKTLASTLELLAPEGMFYCQFLDPKDLTDFGKVNIPEGFLIVRFEQPNNFIALRKNSSQAGRIREFLEKEGTKVSQDVYKVEKFSRLMEAWSLEKEAAQSGGSAKLDGGAAAPGRGMERFLSADAFNAAPEVNAVLTARIAKYDSDHLQRPFARGPNFLGVPVAEYKKFVREDIADKVEKTTGALFGPVHVNFLGGFDSAKPFYLSPAITDVVSVDRRSFGTPEDIVKFTRSAFENDLLYYGVFDSERRTNDRQSNYGLSGMGASAVVRIAMYFGASISGIHFFRFDPAGEMEFAQSAVQANSGDFPNAMIQFTDPDSSKAKRFWYMREDLNLPTEGFQEFFDKKIEYQSMGLSGAFEVFRTVESRLSRPQAITTMLLPTVRQQEKQGRKVVVITDEALNGYSYDMWARDPAFIEMSRGEAYGYSRPVSQTPGERFFPSRVYFGTADMLISSPDAPARRDGGAETPGGIDLRRLPVKTETQVSSPARVMPDMAVDPRLDAEWREIQDLVNKGFLPESGRIKECLLYCQAGGAPPAGIESMLACLADILRIEEDQNLPTEPCLKEFLVLLESG